MKRGLQAPLCNRLRIRGTQAEIYRLQGGYISGSQVFVGTESKRPHCYYHVQKPSTSYGPSFRPTGNSLYG